MARTRSFVQVDVFTEVPYRGNPLAVVLDSEGLSAQEMQRFASWTNLSETTFLLPPTTPDADYRVRIFTADQELPFAGHPTLGSAHAWLQAGGIPQSAEGPVQECGAGLVTVRRDGSRLEFGAPPLLRSGPVEEELVKRIADGLGLERSDVRASQWIDNGPGWVGVLLDSAEQVLAVRPRGVFLTDLSVGIVAPYPPGSRHDYEVRAFFDSDGLFEDPVTGSLNAGLGQWLIGTGIAPAAYTAGQGQRRGRDGVVSVRSFDGQVWVGGHSVTCIRGTVDI